MGCQLATNVTHRSVSNPPLVTYIVPIFNRERVLRRMLSSVVRQSYRPMELVLVDDGSNDGSWSCIQKFAGECAKYDFLVRSTRHDHVGVAASRNVGMALASGDFVGFLDSDDWIPPQRTIALVDSLMSLDADLCFGNHTAKEGLIKAHIG